MSKISVDISNGMVEVSKDGAVIAHLTKDEAMLLAYHLEEKAQVATDGRPAGSFWIKFHDETIEVALASYGRGFKGHKSIDDAIAEANLCEFPGHAFEVLDADLKSVHVGITKEIEAFKADK